MAGIRLFHRKTQQSPTPTGAVAADELITVTVVVRRRSGANAEADALALGRLPPGQRKYVRRQDFAAIYGADRRDLAEVVEKATAHGLEVVGEPSLERRTIVLRGRADDIGKAFSVTLSEYELQAGVTYRAPERAIQVPRELRPLIEGVFGFDTKPRWGLRSAVVPASAASILTVPEAVKRYGFPAELGGHKQCIAILSLGGGYFKEDLAAFFSGLGFDAADHPTVVDVSGDGSHNDPQLDPMETTLDIEVAGAVAPRAHIAVYFGKRDDQGFISALSKAVHDGRHSPSVISISFAQAEPDASGRVQAAADQYFVDAALLGVTVCAASGDWGSSGGGSPDGRANVCFPASSPHVLACGGTMFVHGETRGSHHEVVWNEVAPNGNRGVTGGGVSQTYKRPEWQKGVNVPKSPNPPPWFRRIFGQVQGHGVPDVAGHAAGFHIYRQGKPTHDAGTSAVAPLWAGLVALVNEGLGARLGYLNPYLYEEYVNGTLRGAFNDISEGDNEVPGAPGFHARHGWDPCTGLGSPNGTALLDALRG